MKKLLLFSIAIFFSALFVLQAQNKIDISFIKNSATLESASFGSSKVNINNEYELLFSGLFLFYKSIFSSQDIPGACSFTPSCSEYGMLSIKKTGSFLGIINTFDRLARCHGMSSEQYSIDKNTGKYLDYP